MTTVLSDAPATSLRQRMIEDMNMRRFTRKTQFDYVRQVARFATYLGRPPDTATVEELRQFQVEQREAGIGIPTMNSIVSALRFFFTHTIDRPDLSRKLYTVKNPRSLPVVLSRDEVVLLLGATNCLKHKAALSVAYGAGLRAAEVTMLKVRDVDSKRMLLRVERGKGGRYRNALLPADLLALLREWWTVGRKQGVDLALLHDRVALPGRRSFRSRSVALGINLAGAHEAFQQRELSIIERRAAISSCGKSDARSTSPSPTTSRRRASAFSSRRCTSNWPLASR